MRTVARAPMVAPLKMQAPVAMKTSSSMRQPLRCACGPTSTCSPSDAGWCATPRITACSMMMHRSPIVTGPLSAVSTAPKRTRLSAPTVTSPQMVALGAT